MYNEPDWSTLTLSELLEKAHEFSKTAYSNTMSSYAFLDRALDRLTPGTELGAEVVALADKARAVYNMLAALQSDMSKIKGSVDDSSAPS
jgi:hypothetical protein